jgi:tRNA-Thr(GGU) m(6)t(6)A37 methyltransferase TsaA
MQDLTPGMRFELQPVGVVRSPLKDRASAPCQGDEGAPDAWIELTAAVAEALEGIEPGDELIVITWLHEARRETLRVRPRGDESRPLTGVFATRSPDRPNPLGLHRVTALELEPGRLKVGPLEAIDGTPVVDIKPVLRPRPDQ